MRFSVHRMPIRLSNDPLRLSDARGAALRVLRGRVWITQEGSPDDVFLEAGATHRFTRDGTAIVSAESGRGHSAVVMFEAPLVMTARPALKERLRRLFERQPAPRCAVGAA